MSVRRASAPAKRRPRRARRRQLRPGRPALAAAGAARWRKRAAASPAPPPLARPRRATPRPRRAPALDHMQPESRGHEARQHAHLALPEDRARELGGAVAGLQPAELATLGAAGAVGPPARRIGEGLGPAAQVEQAGLGAAAQQVDIHAGRHREQHVAHLGALTPGKARGMRRMVAPALGLVGFGHPQFAFEPGLDRLAGRLVEHAVPRCRVVHRQQAAGLPAWRSSSVQARWRSVAASSDSPGACSATPLTEATALMARSAAGSAPAARSGAASAPAGRAGTGRPASPARSIRAPGG